MFIKPKHFDSRNVLINYKPDICFIKNSVTAEIAACLNLCIYCIADLLSAPVISHFM